MRSGARSKVSCTAQGGRCTDSVAHGPVKTMHGYMMSQAGHAASPVCSMAVHRGLASL